MRYSTMKAVVKKCPTQTKAQKWRAAQTGKPEYSQSLYNPKGGYPCVSAISSYSALNLRKIFPAFMAIISDTTPENKTTAYSYPLHSSNRMPYIALPSGCEHMEIVRMTAITFPIKFCGVSDWIKDIICTVKSVENTIMAKQHTVMTI